jgi:hypothetical protein
MAYVRNGVDNRIYGGDASRLHKVVIWFYNMERTKMYMHDSSTEFQTWQGGEWAGDYAIHP